MLSLSTLSLIAVLFFYLASPLLVYFNYTIQARPKVQVFDPSQGMPEAVRKNFEEKFHEFTALGFRHLGTFTLPNAIKNYRSVFALYENEEHQIMGGTNASFVKLVGVWNLRSQSITLGTTFTDGCEVETTNLFELYDFPVAPGSLRTQHPELKKAQDVFGAHLAMVSQYRKGRPAELTLQSKYGGDIRKYFAESLFEEFGKAVDVGRLRLKEVPVEDEPDDVAEPPLAVNPFQAPGGEEFTKGSVFVPTLKGAYIAVLTGLWPFRPIIRRGRFARYRKMLAETGFQWP